MIRSSEWHETTLTRLPRKCTFGEFVSLDGIVNTLLIAAPLYLSPFDFARRADSPGALMRF